MLPVIPLALGGSALAVGFGAITRRKRSTLIQHLVQPDAAAVVVPIPPTRPSLATTLIHGLAAADDAYHRFIQTHIDPHLGKARHAQMHAIVRGQGLALSQEERYANRRIGVGVLALGAALVGQFVYPPAMLVAIALGLSTSWMLYYWAYQEWRRTHRLGALHPTCLYIAVLWLGGYATVGAAGAVLVGIVLKLKAITEQQSRSTLIAIFDLQPESVWVRVHGSELEMPFDQVQMGDILVLHAGQRVPVDGTIIAGTASIDQHMLTGEAQPVEKTVGDTVLAATLILSGKIDLCVEKTGSETAAGQIAAILNQSAQYNAHTTLRVLNVADRFALPTLVLSAVSWPMIGLAGAASLLGANSTINSYASGSLAVLNILNLAAARGILIKDGRALEGIHAVDTIVFDKTGTLTLEQPEVVQVYKLHTMDADTVLLVAAAAEARQTHPIARAILSAATERGLNLPAIEQAHYDLGAGLKVWLHDPDPTPDSHTPGEITNAILVRVGSQRFMTQEGILLPDEVSTLTAACEAQGHSLVLVAINDALVGGIELQPTVRPEARQIIQGLRKRGLDVYIISGDQETPTRTLAHDLGMTGYYANTLPTAKANLVAQLQQEGRQVCFIGDGINDALAMRTAQVSISLRGATTAATDTAQIILMDGTLTRLLDLFELAGELERTLIQNICFTTGVSAVAVVGILLGGWTFAATEVLFAVSLLGGLGIATKPLLQYNQHDHADDMVV